MSKVFPPALLLVLALLPAARAGDVSPACDTEFLDRARLQKFVADRGVQSISEIVGSLPPCYRESHVAIYKSSSLQCATPKAPRIAIFVDGGSTSCTFNSGNREDYKEFYERDPNTDCHENSMECQHFTGEPTAKFEYFEINGAKDDRGKATLKPLPPEANGHAHVSGVNPATCMTSCHRGLAKPGNPADPRPVIEVYPNWAGFYGSFHDELFKGNETDTVPSEKKNFIEQYLPYKAANPRYSQLTELVEVKDGKLVPLKGLYRQRNKPNIDLQNTLENQNFQRLARKLAAKGQDGPTWPFRYALIGALACNTSGYGKKIAGLTPDGHWDYNHPYSGPQFPMESFIPESLRTSFAVSYQQAASDVLQNHQKNLQVVVDEQKKAGELAPEVAEKYRRDMANDPKAPESGYNLYFNDEFANMSRLSYVARNLGLPTDDWSLTFRDTLDFGAGSHNSQQILAYLLPRLLAADEKDLVNWNRSDLDAVKCEALRKKSLEALANVKPAAFTDCASAATETAPAAPVPAGTAEVLRQVRPKPDRSLPKAPALISECIRCHVHGDEKAFPFDDPARLGQLLQGPTSAHKPRPLVETVVEQVRTGKMPYNVETTEAQKGELIDYFRALAALPVAP